MTNSKLGSFSLCILNAKLGFVELKDKQHQSGFLHSVSPPPTECLVFVCFFSADLKYSKIMPWNLFQFLLSAPSQKLFSLFPKPFSPERQVVFLCYASVSTAPPVGSGNPKSTVMECARPPCIVHNSVKIKTFGCCLILNAEFRPHTGTQGG